MSAGTGLGAPLPSTVIPFSRLPAASFWKLPPLLGRAARSSVLVLAAAAFACSSEVGPGGASAGGAPSNSGGSGASTAGASSGGLAAVGGGTAVGGSSAAAGNSSTTGGSGGASATGGAPSAGSGGAGTGGTSAGTGGGAAVGGMAGAAGGSGGGASCAFPTSFKWSSTGPLANPVSPAGHTFVSLKDFTVTKANNEFVVYASVYDTSGAGSYSGVNFNFSDWSQVGSAPQTYMGNEKTGATVAPTLFYFTPKKTWVLTYQWGFKYATGSDPTNPSTWSSPTNLLTGGPSAAIDQTVICDATDCYLFFAGDNGNIYRSSLPIGSFPGTFNGYQTILTDTTANLFEAVEVYSVKGTGKYLMIVEAEGSGGRYFRALSATSLSGTFTPVQGASTEATPFAGKNNVTFTAGAWTSDISHGDIVRTDPAETQTVDPCNLQFLYQGYDKTQAAGVSYNALPYRPGLLTKTN